MNSPQRKALAALFFLYGFGMVAWVPRFPEIKANLHLGNGPFGTLISFGAIGSIVSLLTTGHLVHRFGSRKTLMASATLLFGAISLIVHVTSVWQFLIANIAFGAGVSAFHISVNSQAFHEQGPEGKNLIPPLHGFWSAGGLTTVILSGFLAGRVPLIVHIDVLAAICYIIILILLRKFGTSFMPGVGDSHGGFSMRSLFRSFNLNWIIVIGTTCAIVLEFAIGDWITIFAKEDLHMGVGISTVPYVLFVLAMVIGRLSVRRLTTYVAIDKLVRVFPIIGGTTFIVAINLGVYVSKSHPLIGFSIVTLGTFISGLGLSFLAPTYIDAANRLSPTPGGILLGQLSLANTILIFFLKSTIAWTAQLTSIAVALMIPSVLLIGVAFTAGAIKKAHA